MANNKYSQEIKDYAVKAYIHDDLDIPRIKILILEKFGEDVNEESMYKWKKEQDWKGLKQKALVRAQDKMLDREAEHRSLDTEDQLDSYRELGTKTRDALKVLQFDKAIDAARAMDMAIKGERAIMEGLIARKFIQGIVTIIMEVVTDGDERKVLGNRLEEFLMEFE